MDVIVCSMATYSNSMSVPIILHTLLGRGERKRGGKGKVMELGMAGGWRGGRRHRVLRGIEAGVGERGAEVRGKGGIRGNGEAGGRV